MSCVACMFKTVNIVSMQIAGFKCSWGQLSELTTHVSVISDNVASV
jgi:hypothetical protein